MPNSRRRRFAVQNNVIQCKIQNSSQSSYQDTTIQSKSELPQQLIQKKSKNKVLPNSSKSPQVLDVVSECESSSSISTVKKISVDKDVTASSSNIDLYNILSAADDYPNDGEICVDLSVPVELDSPKSITLPDTDNVSVKREPKFSRRDKFSRQNHRVKVRSPKRRAATPENGKPENELYSNVITVTVGVNAIDWDQEVEEYIDHVTVVPIDTENVERMSSHSLDDMCRICHGGEALSPELGQMISACACRGTVGRVHVRCLERWLTESGKSRCEICGTRYATRRVHRYGLPKALVMWMLSQNAKQLMVDSLGIMLMSPLAVLAAWLSGRTLAGLMTPDSQVTPWPLASTFVLACMTLVCYYCWIVSAATRHALGWWIWYRSQYEVRLQFQENEE